MWITTKERSRGREIIAIEFLGMRFILPGIVMFGLISKELIIEKDIRRSEEKVYTFYTFPDDIIKILEEKYLIVDQDLGYAYVSELFDRNVFIYSP